MAAGGSACIDRVGGLGTGGRTEFTKSNPFTVGTINSFCIFCGLGTPWTGIKLKVFRQNGTNIDFVAESATKVPYQVGLNSFDISPISVNVGDYIGIYAEWTSGQPDLRSDNGTPGTVYYIDGDIVSNLPESSYYFDDTHVNPSLFASTYYVNVYVNSVSGSDANIGDSCVAGHPVLTFAKAFSILGPGGTIHVCNSGADFNGETVTLNKPFSIDLNGASGYFYMPKAS